MKEKLVKMNVFDKLREIKKLINDPLGFTKTEEIRSMLAAIKE